MEKLSLDQLEVENFATQVSEEELLNLKGGSTGTCISAAGTVMTLWNTFFGGGSGNSSSGPYLQTDSATFSVDVHDTTYFHSQTYRYGY